MSWHSLSHAVLYLSAGSVGMSVRSAVNAVLTELVRSLSRALAAVLWRISVGGPEPWGTSLPAMAPIPTPPPPTPPHSFLFLFTLMWKADGDEEDRRKAAELRSSEPDPSLPFSSSSSERSAMSPYKKRPAGGAVRSMANVIVTATSLTATDQSWRSVSSRMRSWRFCKVTAQFLLTALPKGVRRSVSLYPRRFADFCKPRKSDVALTRLSQSWFKRSAGWS